MLPLYPPIIGMLAGCLHRKTGRTRKEGESPTNSTGDHFHPMCWGHEEVYAPSCKGAAFAWDGAKNETKEIAVRRHQEGSNYIYMDGHAKWHRWSQVYWQDAARGIYEGNFDPRQ